MKCLIIAAGQGTRLRSIAASKPLARVAGLPLIEHVVAPRRRPAARPGSSSSPATSPSRWRRSSAELAERSGLPIEIVRNEDWARPNGLSVLAAGAPARLRIHPADVRSSVRSGDPARHDRRRPHGRRADPRRRSSRSTIRCSTSTTRPRSSSARSGRIRRIGKTLAALRRDRHRHLHRRRPSLLEALRASLAAGGSRLAVGGRPGARRLGPGLHPGHRRPLVARRRRRGRLRQGGSGAGLSSPPWKGGAGRRWVGEAERDSCLEDAAFGGPPLPRPLQGGRIG